MRNVISFFLVLLFLGCQKTDDVFSLIPIPAHFPPIEFPKKNMPTKGKLALGKTLFFDTRLSLDSTLSCASCHLPEFAFSDTIPLSRGVGGTFGKRNAPSLLNTAYVPKLNKDGGVTQLDLFALVPIEDHLEMNISALALTERLASDRALQKASKAVFDRPLDAYAITRSLSTYVRSLISGDSRYDAFLLGKAKLSPSEERGRILFNSDKAKCSNCHAGVLFTNNAFESNGTKVNYTDQGRKLITGEESDRGKYKVPSLRNVSLTAPYMHDGSFASLEQVITHYNEGGKAHENKNPMIKPLKLNAQEKSDLVVFLGTLTDKKYADN